MLVTTPFLQGPFAPVTEEVTAFDLPVADRRTRAGGCTTLWIMDGTDNLHTVLGTPGNVFYFVADLAAATAWYSGRKQQTICHRLQADSKGRELCKLPVRTDTSWAVPPGRREGSGCMQSCMRRILSTCSSLSYAPLAAGVAVLLPLIDTSGAARRQDVAIETLLSRLREEARAAAATLYSAELIGAWAQIPPS
jgi:hypothetical protein